LAGKSLKCAKASVEVFRHMRDIERYIKDPDYSKDAIQRNLKDLKEEYIKDMEEDCGQKLFKMKKNATLAWKAKSKRDQIKYLNATERSFWSVLK